MCFVSKITGRTIRDPEYTYAWTAVSKPPWLTALALWPKGDCWHGGGLFEGDRKLMLNHRPERSTPHPRHKPDGLKVRSNPEARGEDGPVYSRRLVRDGWELIQDWQFKMVNGRIGYSSLRPQIRRKRHPEKPWFITMQQRVDNLRYSESFALSTGTHDLPLPEGKLDWVDWDQRGRLVVLHNGQIRVASVEDNAQFELQTLIDLSGDTPVKRESPMTARRL